MSRISISDEFLTTVLRIALASIWLNAGVLGKLLNPGFLNPNSNQYVGLTIQYFAEGSIIRGFLYAVAFPHPILTGILVMVGEISFGVSLLLGLGVRLSSTVAFYTNLIYFLSAAWTGAEEYGINLLMMILDAYFVVNGGGKYCVDNYLPKVVNNAKVWAIAGSVLYLGVVLFLYFYGM